MIKDNIKNNDETNKVLDKNIDETNKSEITDNSEMDTKNTNEDVELEIQDEVTVIDADSVTQQATLQVNYLDESIINIKQWD